MDLQLNETVTFEYRGKTYTGKVVCLDYDDYEATMEIYTENFNKRSFFKILEMEPTNK